MRIAIVINTSWNIYNYRKGLIKAFLENGHQVIAIAPIDNFSEELVKLGCQFIPVKMDNKGVNPLKDLQLLLHLFKTYNKIKPDCVLHYTIKPNVFGSLACCFSGIKCISNVSGLGTVFIRKGWVFFLVRLLYKLAFLIPEKVFFQNQDDRDLFVELNILKEGRTGLLPGSGINVSYYEAEPFQIHQPFKFLLVARLLKDKGIEEYAEASGILKAKGYKFECDLVGFFDRESKFNVTVEEIENWVNSGHLNFLGESTEIAKEINNADCIVLPSYREGTPRSLLEGMALAKPIITTNVPGCKEVIVDGENGFICEPKSAISLAAAMEKMLNSSIESLIQMGEKGRLLAETKFDERIVIKSYLGEIAKISNGTEGKL